MSAGKNKKRKNQSIRENTSLIAANLVRASSLVLAEMALGPLSDRSARAAPIEASPVLLHPVNMRRVVTGSPSTGYVMEPGDNGKSVDTIADEFIQKVKQQYQYGSHGAAVDDISNSCIPPPPPNTWPTYPR